MAATTQQQISVTDLDVPQLADVRRQLDEVRPLPTTQITLVIADRERRS
jgi:S-adenosylhomocysteine hydrolase